MENNFKYIVYQTINIVNNKIYVGFHKTKDPNIFDGYIGNGVNIHYPSTYMNPKWPFQYAVKKYGTSNFRRSVLFIFDSAKEALDKEREIVNEEFIKRSDTYNLILGGNLRPVEYISNKIYQFDIEGNLIRIWNDCFDIANFYETWKSSIYGAITHKRRLYGYYWSFNDKINTEEFTNPNLPNKTYKYDKNGKCVEIYESAYQAALANNQTPKALYSRIKEGALTKGYYYSYTLYDEYIPKQRMNLKKEILYLYDLNGNYIDKFSYEEFKKYLNIHTIGKLGYCIINKQPYLEKYLVTIKYFDKLEPYKKKDTRRPVLVYLKDGTFVKECESVCQALKEFNLDSSTVNKILKGTGKFTKGYTLKYKN